MIATRRKGGVLFYAYWPDAEDDESMVVPVKLYLQSPKKQVYEDAEDQETVFILDRPSQLGMAPGQGERVTVNHAGTGDFFLSGTISRYQVTGDGTFVFIEWTEASQKCESHRAGETSLQIW